MAMTRRSVLGLLAVVLVAPAGLFYLSAIGRSLQPTTHEPARTLEAIVTWFSALPTASLVVSLIALPAVAVLVAALATWRSWRDDPDLRSDAIALGRAARAFVRHPTFIVGSVVIVFALLSFATLAVHAVAG